MDRPDQTTHFGFRDVPLEDKQAPCELGVSQRGLALRSDERPDVGRAAPRLEGHHGQHARSAQRRAAVRAARRRRRHRRYRVSRGEGARRRLSRHRLRHQCRHAAGRPGARRQRGISTIASALSKAMRKRWRLPIAPSTATPSRSASATCRGSIARSAKPIACSSPAAGSSAWNSRPSTCPGSIALYDLFSFKVIPPLGRAITGDAESYQYLVESIRKFPKPAAFADMIRAAGFSRVNWQSLSGGIVALHSGWRL